MPQILMRPLQLPTHSTLRFHDLPGAGRPLVFVHGLGCASSCDYPTVARDPALLGRRAILVDLLGFGFSDRPNDFSYTIADHAQSVAELVRCLKLTDFDLFGHSMGGAVAIELAASCAEAVHALVLSEPNLDPGGGLFSRAIAAMSEEDYLRAGHARNLEMAAASGQAIWAGSMQIASALAVHRSAKSLVAGSVPTWRAQLLALPMPRTVIFGQLSLPDDDFDQFPNARVAVAVVPDAGHSMAWENPSGLARAIARACDA
ncbi:2-hydroxy-6-oxo-2,4-heptadienoate hydrolase [Burkholderiales bacterium]|nr:2-hydroxy-6-oxo-2,4-heptadienoate hydrolase [Burkholderiales bacterium]